VGRNVVHYDRAVEEGYNLKRGCFGDD
jgi:hypothetical protein